MIELDDYVVRKYIGRLVGEEGVELIEKMPEEDMTDEKLSEITGILINSVRRTLTILYENKLVLYKKVRDSNSGWITYLWCLNLKDIKHQLLKEQKKLLKHLKIRVEFEKNNIFYSCPDNCVRLLFDEATDCEFICPLCGADLIFEDNTRDINAIEKCMRKLEKCNV